MLLAVDIGNTNIVLGLFEADRLAFRCRLASDTAKTADEYGFLLNTFLRQNGLTAEAVDACAISSVVPQLDGTFDTLIRSFRSIEPFFVNNRIRLNIRFAIENPDELGADRIVNAAAAYDKFRTALIIMDFGTATTVEYLSAGGVYQGGLILPGPDLMKEALRRRTAKLPAVQVRKPDRLLGRNTVESIQSGLYHMHLGGLSYIIRRIRETEPSGVRVVATGGLAGLMARDLPDLDAVEPDLTLCGLRFLYGLNHS